MKKWTTFKGLKALWSGWLCLSFRSVQWLFILFICIWQQFSSSPEYFAQLYDV